MPIVMPHPRLAQLLEQRCFFLFLALLALLVAIPFLGETAHGRVIVGLVNISMLVTAVAAGGTSRLSVSRCNNPFCATVTFQFPWLHSGPSGHQPVYLGR